MKLVFVRSNSFSSWIVRLVEGLRSGRWALAPWSHVAIVCADGLHIIDSMACRGGVTVPRTLASFVGPGGFVENLLVGIACDPMKEAAAQAWLTTQVGKSYDWRGLWGFVVGRNTDDPSRWYCFELAAEAMRRAGVDITDDRIDCFKLLRAAGAG